MNNKTSSEQLIEIINNSINLIVEEKPETALTLLKNAEKKFEKVLQSLELKIKIIINHNIACCYQKMKNVTKCISYLEKVNNDFDKLLEKKHSVKIDLNYFLNNMFSDQRQNDILLGDFILELRFCAKFHLQMCAAFSQANNHIEALTHAKISALICEDNIIKTYHLLNQLTKQAEINNSNNTASNNNNKEFSPLFEEKLKENEKIISHLNQVVYNIHSQHVQDKEILSSEKILSFLNQTELKISTRNILGVIKTDDWLNLFNIGNIMYLCAMSYDDLDLDSDPKYELLRDAIIEKILMLSVAYFSISNEIRFLKDKKDNGNFYHSKALEIACEHLPTTCPIVKHYISTYCKYYGNGSHIDLDNKKESYSIENDPIIAIVPYEITITNKDMQISPPQQAPSLNALIPRGVDDDDEISNHQPKTDRISHTKKTKIISPTMPSKTKITLKIKHIGAGSTSKPRK